MEMLLALSVGVLVAASVYLMLDRNILRFLFGLALLSNAVNLLIFASGRLTPGAPPLIDAGEYAPTGVVANALPQALVLTAIVIAFAMTAVSIVLAMRSRSDNHSDHVDAHEPDDDLQDERVPPRQGEDRA